MANQFWLYDETNDETLNIENNFADVNITGTKRAFKVANSGGSSGGFMLGNGNYNSKTITISRQEWVESGDASAWNSQRDDFTKWITKGKNTILWLYILNGEGTKTIKTRIYPISVGNDKLKNLAIADSRIFTFISPTGIFTNIAQTTAIATEAIVAGAEHEITISNNGVADCYPIITFVPTTSLSYFYAKKSDGNGLKMGFSETTAGLPVTINTSTMLASINSNQILTATHIISGGPFTIAPDDKTFYFKSDVAGTLTVTWYERYI